MVTKQVEQMLAVDEDEDDVEELPIPMGSSAREQKSEPPSNGIELYQRSLDKYFGDSEYKPDAKMVQHMMKVAASTPRERMPSGVQGLAQLAQASGADLRNADINDLLSAVGKMVDVIPYDRAEEFWATTEMDDVVRLLQEFGRDFAPE